MSAQKTNEPDFIFGKINYLLMVGGMVLIGIGFLLMIGGASKDPNVFNAEEIYSFRRITLAPIIVMLGLLVEVFAIVIKPKD